MKAPQYGFTEDHSFEIPGECSPIEPAKASVVAYAGSSTFRPAAEPTVVVKLKRRRWSADGPAGDADALTRESFDTSEDAEEASRSPKVFLLAPQQPFAPDDACTGPHAISSHATSIALQPQISETPPQVSEPDEPPPVQQVVLNAAEIAGLQAATSSRPFATPDDRSATRLLSPALKLRRRRNPLTAPVLLRHEVFSQPGPQEPTQEPAVETQQGSADDVVSYRSVIQDLHRLRQRVEALMRARDLVDRLVL